MTRIRNRGEISTTKSPIAVAVPFVIALIVIALIVKLLFGGSNDTASRSGASINVAPKQEQSEIYIYMSGDAKKRIDTTTKMYSTDNKLAIVNGEAEISLDGNSSKIFADKWVEMKYAGANQEGKQTFILDNAYLWSEVSDQGGISFVLKSFRVNPSTGSILVLSQNAIASNVYILKGTATVETIASVPRSTTLGVGQQLTVLKNEVENTNFTIAEKIEPISDFLKTIDIFVRHGGDALLASSVITDGMTGTGASQMGSGNIQANGKSPIIVIYPEDESSIEAGSITIEGNVISSLVDKITINDKEALFNRENKTFTLKDFTITSNVNNIVYKSFDKEGGLLSKGLLTVYSANKNTKDDAKKPSVTTYPISDKQFQIISPGENPYKTSDDVVKIEGRVVKGTVKYITINDFRLSKFPQLGSTWYYFANKDYGTMNDGINLYTIKYYGPSDELLFTNLFTIVKEAPKTTPPDIPTTDTSATGSTTTPASDKQAIN